MCVCGWVCACVFVSLGVCVSGWVCACVWLGVCGSVCASGGGCVCSLTRREARD